MSEEAITRLDARGLRCPEPVMLLHARIRKLGPGAELEVIATDPTTQRDIAAFCEHLGHQILESREEHGEYLFRIRKRASV